MRKLFTAIVALVSVAAFAQFEPPAKLADLDFLKGKWSGKMDMTLEGQAVELIGTMEVVAEGQTLKMTTTSDMMGMKMVERSYVCWNEGKSTFTMYTFADFAAMPRVEHGNIKDGVWTTISEPWAVSGMGDVVSRSTVTVKGDSLTMTVEFKNGDKWEKVGTGKYTKQK